MFADELFLKKGLSLEKLKNFVDVANAGGIAKVTDDVNRQSLISRQIKEMEGFFGVELTRRKGKTLDLTAKGRHLAEIGQLQLTALDDFLKSCSNEEIVISIGAGNSILEWLLLPRIKEIRNLMPRVKLDLRNFRSSELVRELSERSLDLAIVRTNAIGVGLKHKPLGTLRYSLFVPRELIPQKRSRGKQWIKEVPIASLATGQFYANLQSAYRRAKITLQISLICSSFTQAAEALKSGAYGAILPSIAMHSLSSSDIEQIELPWFSRETRQMSLAWNPRVAQVRDKLSPLIDILTVELKDANI